MSEELKDAHERRRVLDSLVAEGDEVLLGINEALRQTVQMARSYSRQKDAGLDGDFEMVQIRLQVEGLKALGPLVNRCKQRLAEHGFRSMNDVYRELGRPAITFSSPRTQDPEAPSESSESN